MTSTKQRYRREIEEAIAKAKAWREVVTVTADDGTEAYAYQKPEGRIAWGANAPETASTSFAASAGRTAPMKRKDDHWRPERAAFRELEHERQKRPKLRCAPIIVNYLGIF